MFRKKTKNKYNISSLSNKAINVNVTSEDLKKGAVRQLNRIQDPMYRFKALEKELNLNIGQSDLHDEITDEIENEKFQIKRPRRSNRRKGPLIVNLEEH